MTEPPCMLYYFNFFFNYKLLLTQLYENSRVDNCYRNDRCMTSNFYLSLISDTLFYIINIYPKIILHSMDFELDCPIVKLLENEFICPIYHKPIHKPVITPIGITYEK